MRRCALHLCLSSGLGAVECPFVGGRFQVPAWLLSAGVIAVQTNGVSGCLRVGEWERRRPSDWDSRGSARSRSSTAPARRLWSADLTPADTRASAGRLGKVGRANHRAASLQLGAMGNCETLRNREPARIDHASARLAGFASERDYTTSSADESPGLASRAVGTRIRTAWGAPPVPGHEESGVSSATR